jgi:hypothetical protein
MLRSETVHRYKIVIPKDNAWEVLSDLGTLGCLEFIQHENNFEIERRNLKMTKHAEDVLKSVTNISAFLQEQEAKVSYCQNYDKYLLTIKHIIKASGVNSKNYFSHVAEVVKQFSDDITKNSTALSMLVDDLVRAEEELTVNQVLKSSIPSHYK